MLQGSRNLLATARATSVSTGGTATSVSKSSGSSDVTTEALAAHGGNATSVKAASDSGKHSVSTVADANTTISSSVNTPPQPTQGPDANASYADVPACKQPPPTDANTTGNSAGNRDSLGRLWGWENGTSCAYKSPDNMDPSDAHWLSAPRCTFPATEYNVQKDKEGHPWGFDHSTNTSCSFRDDRVRLLVPLRDFHSRCAVHSTVH